ncbi:hypothetical protein P7K49_020615 [Saguinus oedipus]|uniref:Piwi domain-containing protein n=1 Tax=Saguinus oedipus TaxID=9490 RepID=A0ABQ9V0N7_SAGOE|nr:hypothetical protein P7K49_020615 [Saguinus oedipus]
MRNDFNVMKDLAVHTRLTPEQRQREVGRLIDYIHNLLAAYGTSVKLFYFQSLIFEYFHYEENSSYPEILDKTKESSVEALREAPGASHLPGSCCDPSTENEAFCIPCASMFYNCSLALFTMACVVARTLGKQQTVMAIATKIALQMNCKMGGELWRVDMPLKLAMIVGIDCYHDTTAGRRSIAGFVASINEGMTR